MESLSQVNTGLPLLAAGGSEMCVKYKLDLARTHTHTINDTARDALAVHHTHPNVPSYCSKSIAIAYAKEMA